MRWRYHYPQREFPYSALVQHGRGRNEPEFELLDTGAFAQDRYWAVTVDHAKAAPTDLCTRITVENRGPDAATLHVLPTLWFRNTWAWGLPGQDTVPTITAAGDGTLVAEHAGAGRLVLGGDPGAEQLLCDNESNAPRLWGVSGRSAYPKDGSTTTSSAARPRSTRTGPARRAHCGTGWTCPPGGPRRCGCG